MGAWGAGVFENDDAGDWVWEFQDQGVAALEAAFAEVLAQAKAGYVEAPTASNGLAAAAIVAIARGAEIAGLDPESLASIEKHRSAIRTDLALVTSAKAAIDVIMTTPETSELYGLWWEGSSEIDEDFVAAVEEVQEGLRQ